MPTIIADPVLEEGACIQLHDGRVRGPIIAGKNAQGEKVFTLGNNYDTDLHLGWWMHGTYASSATINDFDRSRDVRRILTLEEAISMPGSVITLPGKKAESLFEPTAERLEPVLMSKSQRETVFQLIAERQTASEVPQTEPQKRQPRVAFEVKPLFEYWLAGRLSGKNRNLEIEPLDAFTAGYNAALRNEIGQGIQPSEKAQGGLSGSERVPVAVTAAYRKGFEDAFGATSEGYNGEYPFQRKGIDFKTDDDWQRFYRAFMLDADLTAKPEPKLPPIPTPDELAEAMLKSIGKSLAGMGDTHKPLWTGMAKVAIEELRGPNLHPWKPQPIYKPGNHPAHIEADMALEAAIEAAI